MSLFFLCVCCCESLSFKGIWGEPQEKHSKDPGSGSVGVTREASTKSPVSVSMHDTAGWYPEPASKGCPADSIQIHWQVLLYRFVKINIFQYVKVGLICCCSVTVVHDYKVYWVRIAGPVVSLRGMTAAPTTAVSPQTTSPTTLSTQVSISPIEGRQIIQSIAS